MFRHVAWWALSGLVVLSGAAVGAAAERPNIVLCMADDQGWGDTGYNGHAVLKTPTLDAMAASGLRLDRFYAAAPVCSPTRGSVLTGRHPNRFACFSWGHMLRPQEVTLAEALQTVGYATGHFGKWHLGPVRAESPVSPGSSGFDEWFSSPNFFENSPLMSHRGRVVKTEGEGSQVVVDAALEFIRQAAGREQPFLAVVWFGSPHLPHEALAEDRALYKDLPEDVQHYLGEITAMDRAIGRLRDELRRLQIADNTVLWYTSDNGSLPPGSTGGLAGKKGTLWEGGIRVPGIIEWPARVKSPVVSDLPCGSVDIYPTVQEIVGFEVEEQPQPLDGASLLPLIDGRAPPRGKPLGFWVYPAAGRPMRSTELLQALAREQTTPGQAEPADRAAEPQRGERDPSRIAEQYSDEELPGHAAWIEGTYKLHRLPGKAGKFSYALYDLASDRQEERDLALREPERVARMKADLEAWQKSVVGSLNGGDYRSAP